MNDDKPESVPESKKLISYGAPPEATRFKKGASGNPKGRPKGSLNMATVFAKTLRERVVVNERGQRKTITKLEAALKQLVNKAASGDLRALAQLVVLAQDAEAKQNMRAAQDPDLSDLDEGVMEGILQRFGKDDKADQPAPQEHASDETHHS
jgi:Family of unknown function (DUF5681)